MANNKQTQPPQGQQPVSSNPAPAPGAVNLDDGYNITQQVDPAKIAATQVESDLAALKAAEQARTSQGVAVKKEEVKNKPQELSALELANPFRGE